MSSSDLETNELNKSESTEENELSDITGSFGRWQLCITTFLLIGNFFSAINALSGSFYAPNLSYWCTRPDKYKNMPIDQWIQLVNNTEIMHCWQYEQPDLKCTSWEYDLSFYKNTIIDEWNLVCDRSWLISATKSSYMFGAMVSVFLFGQLADIYGRFKIIWICLSMELIAGCLSSYTSSIYIYILLRFLVAVGESGKWSTGYVLVLEVTGANYRNLIGNGIQLGWAVGYIVIPLMAYYVPDYKNLQLISILPEVVLFAWFTSIPESPRWLLTRGKKKEVIKTLRNAASINKMPLDMIEEKVDLAHNKIKQESMREKLSLLGLFRTPNLRRKTLILYFSWFVNAFVYYGLSFNTNDLGGNAYINFVIAGAVEFPAYLLVIYLSSKFGRQSSLMSLTLLAGLACLACAPIAENDNYLTLRIVFAMLGKFFVTASFGLIYLYTAELFPTVARNVGVGSSSMIARFGSTLAPFVKELGDITHLSVPMGIFGGLAVIDTFLLLGLPETKDRVMPDSLDQAENSE